MQLVFLIGQNFRCPLQTVFDQILDFGIDQLVRFSAAHGTRGLSHAEIAFLALLVLQGTELVRHAPLGDHVPGEIGGVLNVAAGTARYLVVTEDDLFCDAAAHSDRQVRVHLVTVVGIAVPFRQTHDHAQRATARNDRCLMDGIGCRLVQRHQRVAGLVIGGHLLLILGHDHAAALRTHHDLVLGVFEFLHGDQPLVAARGKQGRFVTQVGEIRPRETGCSARDRARIDVGRQRQLLHMNGEDFLAAVDIRHRHHDLTVETTRTQQCRIEHVGAVGGGDDDDAFVRLEPVHFDQQLVQRLLALVVRIAQPMAA